MKQKTQSGGHKGPGVGTEMKGWSSFFLETLKPETAG